MMWLCQCIDLCFHASSLPCLRSFGIHYIFNVYFLVYRKSGTVHYLRYVNVVLQWLLLSIL